MAEAARPLRASGLLLVAHHPSSSAGEHRADATPEYLARVKRIEAAAGPIAGWLAGHEHDLEHLRAPAGYDVLISGNGVPRPPEERFEAVSAPGARLLFASTGLGFGRRSRWATRRQLVATASSTPPGKPIQCCTAPARGPLQAGDLSLHDALTLGGRPLQSRRSLPYPGGPRWRSAPRSTTYTSSPAPGWSSSPAGTCRSSTRASSTSTRRCAPAVGLFDVSHMGEVVFRGPKALEALQAGSSPTTSPGGRRPGPVRLPLPRERRHRRRRGGLPALRRGPAGLRQRRQPRRRTSSGCATTPAAPQVQQRVGRLGPAGAAGAAAPRPSSSRSPAPTSRQLKTFRFAQGDGGRRRPACRPHRLHRRGRLRALLPARTTA